MDRIFAYYSQYINISEAIDSINENLFPHDLHLVYSISDRVDGMSKTNIYILTFPVGHQSLEENKMRFLSFSYVVLRK